MVEESGPRGDFHLTSIEHESPRQVTRRGTGEERNIVGHWK